jgi:hypothetical protein
LIRELAPRPDDDITLILARIPVGDRARRPVR